MTIETRSAWTLFLDDERYPSKLTPTTVVCRSSDEAIRVTSKRGCPVHIDFDHDLGPGDTSMKYISWLGNQILDDNISIPPGFTYAIHSQNPVGRKNIESYVDQLIKHFRPIPVLKKMRKS